ncbi:MAG: neutral/alkaline non-lysosomal ceramidase N-terminal domain-containing protein, partial [Planctomycetes bacterium]|nr:neutral/alkaline non-lysosomal ceramidase N-terminal domain-containing protein [Planctomycetota bacterium]
MNSLALCCLVLSSLSASAAETAFTAGAATADLTPPPGVSMDGPISKPGPVRGVHDPLHARALVCRLGETSVAIVVCDMCMIDRPVYDHAKRLIQEKTGIPPSRVLASATHSHATPRVMQISVGPRDEAYRTLVAERIADAVAKAQKNLAPAKVGFGSFDRPEYIACRRWLCEPGSVGVNPFGEEGERVKSVAGVSAKAIRPAGPTDPQVSVLSIQHEDGTPLAVLANFSVHYCGGYEPGQVSADYFGSFARELAERMPAADGRPPFVGIMSNGTSGDTGGLQIGEGRAPPWQRIEQGGEALAEATAELIGSLDHRTPGALAAVAAELKLGVRKPSPERIAWARRLRDAPEIEPPHRWSRIYAAETLHLASYPDAYELPLQAIRIGEVAIAAAPCEVFAETGLAIKKHGTFERTFTISLANGYGGYLPTPQQHAWGGYETWPARSSHLETEAEPKIRAALLGLVAQLEQPQQAAAPRPNIVVVLVDDLRWDELSCMGHPFVRTPNVDRLAREGARFRNAFSNAPLCSPARACLLTGRYMHRHGILDNTDRSEQSHRLRTFPQALQRAGYETAFVGKWHMGNDDAPRPGFNRWVGLRGQGTSFEPVVNVDGERVPEKRHTTDVLNRYAAEFVHGERGADRPFCLYVSHKALHPELMQYDDGSISDPQAARFLPAERHEKLYAEDAVPRRLNVLDDVSDKPALARPIEGLPPLSTETGTEDETVRDRLRMLAGVDEGVGQLLMALEETGRLDNTVFVFTSDHGYWYGEHGLSVERRLAYEEGIRVPLLVRFPPIVEPGLVIDAMTCSVDLAPTLLALAGVESEQPMDGRNMGPLLRGQTPANWRKS